MQSKSAESGTSYRRRRQRGRPQKTNQVFFITSMYDRYDMGLQSWFDMDK